MRGSGVLCNPVAAANTTADFGLDVHFAAFALSVADYAGMDPSTAWRSRAKFNL
ncbi:MAG TPA: hypothetical protein VMP68_07915 [Candidatus Eisenbacteria bacterium]|nr:hypothetical protein [Candidatus Eisenbacteria bacterium]